MLLSYLQDAPAATQIGVVLALVAAGLVKGLIGIGMPFVGLPLLAALLGVQPAAMMLSVPLFLSNVPQAFEGGRTRDAFSHISTLLIGAFPGIAAGVYVLDALPPQSLQIFVGATLMLVTTILVVAPRLTIPRTTSWPVATGVGFTSGFIGSPVAMPSGLVFTYLLAQGMRGAHFTKHASLFVMCSSAWLALALLAASGFDPVDLLISGLGILPVLAGMQLGQTLRDRIHATAFKWLVLAAVFGAAADLIRRGLTGA